MDVNSTLTSHHGFSLAVVKLTTREPNPRPSSRPCLQHSPAAVLGLSKGCSRQRRSGLATTSNPPAVPAGVQVPRPSQLFHIPHMCRLSSEWSSIPSTTILKGCGITFHKNAASGVQGKSRECAPALRSATPHLHTASEASTPWGAKGNLQSEIIH